MKLAFISSVVYMCVCSFPYIFPGLLLGFRSLFNRLVAVGHLLAEVSSDSFGLCGREVHCLQIMAFLFVPICVTCVPVLSSLPRWSSGSSGPSPGPHAKRATFCRVVCPLLVACFDPLSGRGVPSQVVLYMFLKKLC